jgi:thioredoxin reductase (NADPH)
MVGTALLVALILACSGPVYGRGVFGGIFGHRFQLWSRKNHRKVVIIGSGPAGSTAAIYAARALLRPLQIAGYNFGGQLMLTSDVENFPGYREPVTGPELIDDLSCQALRFGADVWQMDVLSVDFSKRPFLLKVHNGSLTADSVIISTGANAVWLGATREKEFQGKGISTCATCDGYLFRDQTVVVVGGGDSAMEEANFLSRFAREVIVVHRSQVFKASKIMLDRTRRNPKVRFLLNAEITEWKGTHGILSGLVYSDTTTGRAMEVTQLHCFSPEHQFAYALYPSQLVCQGAFIAIGHRPNTAFLGGQVSRPAQSTTCQFGRTVAEYSYTSTGGTRREGLCRAEGAHDDERAGRVCLRGRGRHSLQV